jgi:hypothetical protein
MKKAIAVVIALTALMSVVSCTQTVDPSGARSFGDSFMADLVANRPEDALSKMEPGLVRLMGRDKALEGVKGVFDHCGRPLDSRFWRDESGVQVFFDGRKKPMRKLYYLTPTTERPQGGCYFTVLVVPGDDGGYRAAAFTVGMNNKE